MVDDLALEAVAWVRQRTRPRFHSLPILGLEGDAQQKLGRGSHEVELSGLLWGETAATALSDLQGKAGAGEEVSFTADIATALELETMVLVDTEFRETAGRPGVWEYRLHLRESPPLPPPAELSPFGGLDGFDLGFDPGALGDVLGDIAAAAGDIQNAIDAATEALDALQAMAGMAGLAVDDPLTPVRDEIAAAGEGTDATGATASLSGVLG